MRQNDRSGAPTRSRLLEIIRVQTEIAQSPLELEKVLEIIAGTAQKLTASDGAVVELIDGDDLVCRSAVGNATSRLGLRVRRESSFAGACVERKEALFCMDSETDERTEEDANGSMGVRSMIAVPLSYKGETVGVLEVMKRIPFGFEQADADTLLLISGLIAAHLSQAAQYESLVDEMAALVSAATHDALTGLYNRSAFYDHLRQELTASRRYEESLGVAVLDLDGLKRINDNHGHRAGDLALKAFAERLKTLSRDSDIVARLGGDEFGVLFTRLESKASGVALGRRLAEKAVGSVELEGTVLPVQSSVGVSVFPEDGADPEQLVRVADEAMYSMKRERKAERKD